MSNIKLLVVGVDAMSSWFWDLYAQNMSTWRWAIDRPDFKKLLLRTDSEKDVPHTGVQWTNQYTGVSPEEHGITQGGWIEEQLDYANVEARTIFEQIDDVGYEQVVYGMPVTYPAPKLSNGVSFSGMPSPLGTEESWNVPLTTIQEEEMELYRRARDQPKDLLQIKDRLPRKDVERVRQWGDALREDGVVQEVKDAAIEMELEKKDHFIELCEEFEPEVAWYGSTIVDEFCHMFTLSNDSPATTAYILMGRVVEKLYRELEPDNILIVSDHGFRKGDQEHDHQGVLITDLDVNLKGLKMQHVAQIISDKLDLGTEWIGEPREGAYGEGDKEKIKKRLGDLGYLG